jgi:hypothetical protein
MASAKTSNHFAECLRPSSACLPRLALTKQGNSARNRQITNDLIFFLLTLLLIFTPAQCARADEQDLFDKPSYELVTEEDTLTMRFSQSWSFDSIDLPAVSANLWGQDNQCQAAVLKIDGHSFISRLNDDESRLKFSLRGATSNLLQIIPVFITTSNGQTGDPPLFVATPARIRLLEDELKELADSVLLFQQRNSCFSCHTALPLAITCKVAAASGLRIPDATLSQIGSDIAGMQSYDGIYYFPQHPDYGVISPTLCAGTVMAIISDFSGQYLENLHKIRLLLPDWLDDDGLLKSDFYFRPLFIGHKTNMLFEAMILQTLYLYSASDAPEVFDDSLRQRLNQLRRAAAFDPAEPIHRQILIMAGTPVLFQFSSAEQPLIIKQLLHLLKNEPEGERADIRALALYLLARFSPNLPPDQLKRRPLQNLGDRIWACFEKIVISLPTMAKNKQVPADNMKQ